MDVLLLLVIFLSTILSGWAQQYSLRLLQSPNFCYGGEVFLIQPKVTVVDNQNQVALSFTGTAYVQMGNSPSGFESLYVGQSCDIKNNCGTKVISSVASVPFVSGVATFQNLMIRTAGTGYTLKIVGRTSANVAFSSIYTLSFDVAVGPLFKLGFTTFVGTATGGRTFAPNPSVSLQDRGGNSITNVNTGTVTAFITRSPSGVVNEVLRPVEQTTVSIYGGVATFQQLYINTAGYPYRLGFLANLAGYNLSVLESRDFTVGVGTPAQLAFENGTTITGAVIRAGEFLTLTPRVKILDAGGNLVVGDSSSGIRISIYDNPAGAILTPVESLFAVATNGKVTFSTFRLDKQAPGVRLAFTLYSYSKATGLFAMSNIMLLSEKFDVTFGPPRKLVNALTGGRAWAGGQPMEIQPVLELRDFGDNVLLTDYSTTVTATLLASPGTNSKIRVDSSATVYDVADSIDVNIGNGTYGTGQEILIYLHFKYEVWVIGSDKNVYINLNVTTAASTTANATLYGDSSRANTLVFRYIVSAGDSTQSFNYLDVNSLIVPSGTTIVDGNNDTVSYVLPSVGISAKKSISIDTTDPQIVSITTNTTSGDYGTGQVINFYVLFDIPVLVFGKPSLILTAITRNSTYAVADYLSIDSMYTSLTFQYRVQSKDTTNFLTFATSNISLTHNNVTSYIKRKSEFPVTNANLTLEGVRSTFESNYNISIDTSAPILDTSYGVQTTHASGTFFPGELIKVYIKFNKPVINYGLQISLGLQGNPYRSYSTFASFSKILNDNKTLEFIYIVPNLVNTSALDIINTGDALRIATLGTYLRRLSTHPETDVNTNTTALSNSAYSLSKSASIKLYGFPPVVSSVYVASTYPANTTTFYPDDYILVSVAFNYPVSFNCHPVLIISAGYDETARYYSGNMSTTLTFKYIVATGNSQQGLYYRYTPNALCVDIGCPTVTTCGIFANATTQAIKATITLPKTGGVKGTGVPLNTTYVIKNKSLTRNTTIVSVKARHANGTYGPGEVIYYDITFTDIVQLNYFGLKTQYPRLYLNIGKYATFAGGDNTKTISFYYVVQGTDYTSDLLPATISGRTSAIRCNVSDPCRIRDRLANPANITTSPYITSDGIALDGSTPYITKIYTTKKTSSYDGWYAAGETIDIFVVYSRPVLVTGANPRLYLSVGTSGQSATYISTSSSGKVLKFQYKVAVGDYSSNLLYSSGLLETTNGKSKIYLKSTIPTLEANYSLPIQKNMTFNSEVIRIDGVTVASVTSISPISSAGRYAVGDTLYFKVSFSHYIVATGRSYFNLNCGYDYCKSTYVGYNASNLQNNPPIPSIATKELFYSYTVAENDFNYDFDYVDEFAYFAGVNDQKGTAYILRASSNPTASASLDLPIPGHTNSLSANADFYVDGYAPFITSIAFSTPSGNYGTGSSIDIEMNFTVAVVVIGTPSILMETGTYDRPAPYHSGSGTSRLIFRYTIQPGDISGNLDYAADRSLLLSASTSFQYNGAKILAASAKPSQKAIIYLNPPGGDLTGDDTIEAIAGVSRFLDLGIRKRGPDYTIQFTANPSSAHHVLMTSQNIFVAFSNEFEIRPTEAQSGDLVGYATDIYDTIAVLGAPNANYSVTTIQTVTTTGLRKAAQQQVQIVQTKVDPQPMKQTFHTTADVEETVGGYFRITYGDHGTSRPIPANVDEEMLHAILSYDFALLGNVTVHREPYIYCACNNAFTWILTFNDLNQGKYEALQFDSTLLTGSGADVVGPTVLQQAAYISGTFSLHGPKNTTSSPVPFDATVSDMHRALGELGLAATEIQITYPLADGTRSWLITFAAYFDSYEVPLLSSNYSQLSGGNAYVWHAIIREGIHGPKGLAGTFALEWRGNLTRFLNSDATADEVKIALEELDVINMVNVERSSANFINGYTWTIEFVEVRYNTPRGYEVERTRNLEPIIPHSKLIGTQTDIHIGAIWEMNRTINIYGAERAGTYGHSAGSVYVFQNTGETWDQVATVVSSDISENNQFGHSVALHGDLLIVGAIGANNNGNTEKQSIYCQADSGFFRLNFRGWVSDFISVNATRQDIIDAIVSEAGDFSNLYPINAIRIEDWGTGGICDGNTAVITFLSPVDSAPQLLGGADTSANLELLTLDKHNITYQNSTATLTIDESQAGTRIVHGTRTDIQQQGSAYIFRASYNCPANVTVCLKKKWIQEGLLRPQGATGLERFGSSVTIDTDTAVVGSPGSQLELGAVYVYSYSSTSTTKWSLLQKIVVTELTSGDEFGHCVALEGNTFVVGIPKAHNGKGAVYVYRRPASGGYFTAAQTLLPTIKDYPLQLGDFFGYSVAISGNQVIVGAPGRDDKTVYRGRTRNGAETDTGSAFIFKRSSEFLDFSMLQKLEPSNVRRGDRFGWDVNIDGHVVIVGAVESFDGRLTPAKAIVEIKTTADYNAARLGSVFRLKWTSTNETGHVQMKTTREIAYDATAAQLQAIMQADLSTGNILVSRSHVDVYNGGYAWTITFVGQTEIVSDIIADASALTGTNAKVEVNVINPSPLELRGNAHIFQQSATGQAFVEQMFVTPFSHQPVDRCGWSVSLSSNYALVGCPNRDTSVSNQNSGAGSLYFLSLLHIQFSSYSYTVNEGSTFTMVIQREASTAFDVDVSFYIESLDRNTDAITQKYIADLFGIRQSSIEFPLTVVDHVGVVGTAVARSQYYGSTHNESRWVDGLYDYRGISDYVPINQPRAFLNEYHNISATIVTTPDTIFESPDENFTIALHAPGIWPSILGRLYTTVTIIDNNDGYSQGRQFDKVYHTPPMSGLHLGESVQINEGINVMVVGSPQSEGVSKIAGEGKVMVHKMTGSHWVIVETHYSPVTSTVATYFGAAVALSRIATRNVSILAVSEPGLYKIHIFISHDGSLGQTYYYETSITAPDTFLPQYKFGQVGTIALDNNVLVIGVPGFETAYVYVREYNNSQSSYTWDLLTILRSSDYDYDLMFSNIHLHEQHFGTAVSVSDRTIAIGAPYADYDKLGSNLVETNWDTQGEHIQSYGRGRVYTFVSLPAEQIIKLKAKQQLTRGTFRLKLSKEGSTEYTDQVSFLVDGNGLKTALEELITIDSVSVTTSAAPAAVGYEYSWTITFHSEWTDPPVLEPQWRYSGCPSCTAFDANWTSAKQMLSYQSRSMGALLETQVLSNPHGMNGDAFGASVALQGDQLIVGAPDSAAMVTTTWDFEAGTLVGWSKTGTAFEYQPTYGDNSYYRYATNELKSVLASRRSVSSRMRGLYYIGTYDQRPGNPSDYSTPHPNYPQGNAQGDGPVGTLTSEVFMIRGTTISLLVGGSCDMYRVYIELLIDGLSVDRITGTCSERMDHRTFDVSLFTGRAAVLRIVDNSVFGHINVDEIRFDWDVHGATFSQGNKKYCSAGMVETPQSGLAYAFLRMQNDRRYMCGHDKSLCSWIVETVLLPSDKRAFAHFGSSISLNNNAGVVAIGAPGASYTGFYKEVPSVYPHQNTSGLSDAAGLTYPQSMSAMTLFQTANTYAPQATGAHGVWYLRELKGIDPDSSAYVNGGAVYIFTKDKAVISGVGTISTPQHWYLTERAKIQPSDEFAEDRFGSAVHLSGSSLVVGSPGQDGSQPDGGAVYIYNASFAALSFAKVEFAVLEGTDLTATVTILRDTNIYRGKTVVEYSTSDITAKGVDADKFDACLNIPTNQRGPSRCGHYQQTSGVLVINENVNSGGFKIRIMNDLCLQRFLRYLQITISVPGSAALQGEIMSARVRIDDDDFSMNPC